MAYKRIVAVLLVAIAAAMAAAPAPAGQSADKMAVAADAFLASLDEDRRAACRHEFDDAERRNWQPVPFGEAGVRVDDLTNAQKSALRSLLESALSETGVATVDGVVLLERILVGLEAERGRVSPYHGEGRYFVTVYGDPKGDAPWGWRMEGHHLSVTFTSVSGKWTAHGPLFVGAQPARVRGGEHDGFRLLGTKDDVVRALFESLDEGQRARAELGDPLPGNVLLTPGRDAGFDEARGLAGADLSADQRRVLRAALLEWAAWLRDDLAEVEKARMLAGLDETRLVWIGGTGVDEPHYWRIVGPHFAIEYAAPERDPDHVHSLWRDVENDFGGDLLRRHLERHHSGAER